MLSGSMDNGLYVVSGTVVASPTGDFSFVESNHRIRRGAAAQVGRRSDEPIRFGGRLVPDSENKLAVKPMQRELKYF
jgi:hypothetical protein